MIPTGTPVEAKYRKLLKTENAWITVVARGVLVPFSDGRTVDERGWRPLRGEGGYWIFVKDCECTPIGEAL